MQSLYKSSTSGPHRLLHKLARSKAGFTIIEVVIAATVMVLAISGSLIVVQQGIRAIDTARYTTLAGQILQSQVEKIRMLTWTQLTSTTYGPGATANATFTPDVASAATAQINRFTAGGVAGRFSQSITSAPSPFDTQMKIITLTANWTGSDGRAHTLSYTTRYLQNGISDFFYTSR
ncbi:MAG: hypothetical protein ABIV50_02605 [Opitutus sp.]